MRSGRGGGGKGGTILQAEQLCFVSRSDVFLSTQHTGVRILLPDVVADTLLLCFLGFSALSAGSDEICLHLHFVLAQEKLGRQECIP